MSQPLNQLGQIHDSAINFVGRNPLLADTQVLKILLWGFDSSLEQLCSPVGRVSSVADCLFLKRTSKRETRHLSESPQPASHASYPNQSTPPPSSPLAKGARGLYSCCSCSSSDALDASDYMINPPLSLPGEGAGVRVLAQTCHCLNWR
jgi:hypothetical protein